MALTIEEDVRRILNPDRANRIYQAFHLALGDWLSNPALSQCRWPRTRACYVFERIVERLLRAFLHDPDVKFFFKDETVKILFDGKLVVRVKKAGDKGLGSNVPTQAIMSFCNQQEDLPGIPAQQKIEIVYILNKMGTKIMDIVAQARDGNMRLWHYSLQPSTGEGALPLPLPQPTAPQTTTDDLVFPKPKIAGKTKKSEETDE